MTGILEAALEQAFGIPVLNIGGIVMADIPRWWMKGDWFDV
jgi:hypothetical protein